MAKKNASKKNTLLDTSAFPAADTGTALYIPPMYSQFPRPDAPITESLKTFFMSTFGFSPNSHFIYWVDAPLGEQALPPIPFTVTDCQKCGYINIFGNLDLLSEKTLAPPLFCGYCEHDSTKELNADLMRESNIYLVGYFKRR